MVLLVDFFFSSSPHSHYPTKHTFSKHSRNFVITEQEHKQTISIGIKVTCSIHVNESGFGDGHFLFVGAATTLSHLRHFMLLAESHFSLLVSPLVPIQASIKLAHYIFLS